MTKDQASPLVYRWRRTRSLLGAALCREGSTLWAGLRDPLLGGLLLLSLLLATLAFQVSPPFGIRVGQQPPDLVYLDGVYAPEPEGNPEYRWSQGETRLSIPGLGQGPYRLDITMGAWRPPDRPPPRLRLESGGHVLLETTADPAVYVYSVLLPADVLRGGNLDLLLRSDTFSTTKYLFSLGVDFSSELDRGELSAGLREQFQQNGRGLTPQALVEVKQAGSNWAVVDGDVQYFVRSEDQALKVYTISDPRLLGVMLRQIGVRPAGGPLLPAPLVLLESTLAVLLVVLLARRLGWSRWVALAAGAAAMLALAAGLAWARPLLTPGLPYLLLGVFCAWAAVVLFQGPLRRLFAWGGVAMGPRAERALWSVVAFFLVVRLAGLLHPALETFDLCFHYHRLESVLHGQLLFTITSGEWRSLDTLYLPSPYLVLAPFWALFGGRLVPFKVMMLLLDTSAALLVAYIAHRVLGRGWASPLAAFFYLTMTQSYVIFSWGIVANIFGQWLLLFLLAFVVSPAGRLERPYSWLAAAGLLVLVMLSHPGAVLLAGVLLAVLMAAALLAPLRGQLPRRSVGRWVLAALLALALAVGLYYSYFAGTMWEALQQMGQGANAEQAPHGGFLVRGPPSGGLGLKPVEVFSLAEGVVAGAQELAAEAQAYYHTGPLLLAAAALVGLTVERRRLAVRLLGLAFWVALGFAVLGLVLNLYVRAMYFLLPFVAIGVAWWLEKLSRRGWAGRSVGVLFGLALLLAGLSFWVGRVLYFGAGCR